MDLDGLGVKRKALLLVDEEFLDILALIALELNYLTHLGVGHDSSIAGCDDESARSEATSCRARARRCDLPNFFLITLRIFFWSNFFGRPCTVVRVLRPLRSVKSRSVFQSVELQVFILSQEISREQKNACDDRSGDAAKSVIRTLNAYVDIVLCLLGFSGVFVGFGEGVCESK